MLASINPLGERARNSRWWITVTAFSIAATLSGAAVGAGVATLGALALRSVPAAARLAGVAVVSAIALAIETRSVGVRLPSPRRQVDEEWLPRYRGWLYGAGFGAQLGIGFATIVSTPAVHAAFAAAVFTASPAAGAAIGAAFGAARSAPLLLARRVRTSQDAVALDAALRRLDRPARNATVIAEMAVGVVALVAALA